MIEILGPILAALVTGSLFKAKLYVLWIKTPGPWLAKNPNGNSARRCKKARKAFLDTGLPLRDTMILPKGVTPI